MSNTNTAPTEEELTKLAGACEAAASKGFLAQCKAANVSDEKAETMHASYVKQREKRAAKYEDMRNAILGQTAEAK